MKLSRRSFLASIQASLLAAAMPTVALGTPAAAVASADRWEAILNACIRDYVEQETNRVLVRRFELLKTRRLS